MSQPNSLMPYQLAAANLTDVYAASPPARVDEQEALPIAAQLMAATQGEPFPIVQAGHPVLREVSARISSPTGSGLYAPLVKAMTETMRKAPGVGLAAPQIGLPLAIAVMEDPAGGDPEVLAAMEREPFEPYAVFNPEYAAEGTELVAAWEGCLSVHGWQAVVKRARRVRVRYLDAAGTQVEEVLSGWKARIFQHETDHLNGVLCHDRAVPRSLTSSQMAGFYGVDVHAAGNLLGFEV